MTTGQLVFYGGLALLGLTIIVAIVFLIKKPTYQPENSIYEGAAPSRTQPLRNGYPTEKETIRRSSSKRTGSMETEAFDDEAGGAAQETEAFDDGIELLPQEQETGGDRTAALFRGARDRKGGLD